MDMPILPTSDEEISHVCPICGITWYSAYEQRKKDGTEDYCSICWTKLHDPETYDRRFK